MKILLQNRVDLYEKKGGDLILMNKYKEVLEERGFDVVISNNTKEELTNYDIIHLFNVTRIHETYEQFIRAKLQKKKIVISPIYHSVKEMERFDFQGQVGILKLFNRLIPNIYHREQLKNIIRFIKDRRQRESIWKILKVGFVSAQKEVLEGVDLLLLQAEEEGARIKEELQVTKDYVITNNAIIKSNNYPNIDIFKKYGLKDYILCVGRIEPRKNQVSLLKSLQKENLPFLFIGSVNKNYNTIYTNEYYKNFKSLINQSKNIHWLEEIPYEELGAFYKGARVHVNPSWFEVVSLVNLEAAAYGTNIVLSDVGYQREYFGDNAFYCDPNNLSSIREAVLKAYNSPLCKNLQEHVCNEYTWEKVADQLIDAYKKVLK